MSSLKTEKSIHFVKRQFEDRFLSKMSLTKVSSPLFVSSSSGIQDNLNGIERPVSFTVKQIEGEYYEIVHSLAKWKRLALAKYQVPVGEGICTDMRALRPDEEDLTSAIHSIYVDQWDWERVMGVDDRHVDFLQKIVKDIYETIKETEMAVASECHLTPFLPSKIEFIHADDLAKMWPDLSPKEREQKILKDKKAIFLIGIGGKLSDGKAHDGRAPDYDDWTTITHDDKKGLNGDIIVWNPVLQKAFEISSMGIRVNQEAMLRQLDICGCPKRAEHYWHQKLLAGELPQSIGGGIGQSRLTMLLLQKKHIGEVQVGAWPMAIKDLCVDEEIHLLI